MPYPFFTPTEAFAALIACLTRAVVTRSAWGLPAPLIALIVDRLRGINQRVAQLAARIRDRRYEFRPVTPHPRAKAPRQPDPLPRKIGWLLKLVPEAVGHRSQLGHLFRDAEMAKLMAAAPASLGRPLRSLCQMLGVTPPPVLAPPRRPSPPKPARPKVEKARPEPPPPRPPRPEPPAWMRFPRTRWTLARIGAPPRRT